MTNGHETERNTAKKVAKTRPAGRRERRASETRLKLFRSAMQLFADRGFQNVTVEDITEAADVGKGTFFNYFATKDHVLGVLAEIQIAKVKEAALQATKGKEPVRAVLHGLVLRIAEEPGRSQSLARALISSFVTSESVRALISEIMLDGRRVIGEIVARGQATGEIDQRWDKDKAAEQLQRSLMGTILMWSLRGEPSLATCIEDSFEHFWSAIAASGKKQES